MEGTAEQLPFTDHSFDAVTIAFGVRNFAHRSDAFQQIYRVLRPGGHLLALDFATPKNPIWRLLFRTYFLYIPPFWGRIISGNKNAYHYLPQSVTHFPQYETLCAELALAGFSKVCFHSYTGGVAVMYEGMKAES